MAKGIRDDDQFLKEAAHQIVGRGYPVKEVGDRIGLSEKTLYRWKSVYTKGETATKAWTAQSSATTCY